MRARVLHHIPAVPLLDRPVFWGDRPVLFYFKPFSLSYYRSLRASRAAGGPRAGGAYIYIYRYIYRYIYIVMVCILMAYVVMADTLLACIGMA